MNKKDFAKYIDVFLDQNSKLNLISKNDEKYLWEKHIFDSLALEKFFDKYGIKLLKDSLKTLFNLFLFTLQPCFLPTANPAFNSSDSI